MMRRFKPFDCPEICGWYKAWKMEPIAGGRLPEMGYIVPGVAAGFVYLCEARMAFIEGLIANPAKSKACRDEALDLIVLGLIDYANEQDRDYIFGFTKLQAVVDRGLNHKFKPLGTFHMMAKEIK